MCGDVDIVIGIVAICGCVVDVLLVEDECCHVYGMTDHADYAIYNAVFGTAADVVTVIVCVVVVVAERCMVCTAS